MRPPRPVRRPAWRRARRGPGISVLVAIALVFMGGYTAWGRGAGAATAGDCVYHQRQDWRITPCSLPPPWRDTANYKVLGRVEGTSAECGAAPGWAAGDNAAVLPGWPPVTLCLAPMR